MKVIPKWLLFLSCLLVPIAHARELTHCPDLINTQELKNWHVLSGRLHAANFRNVRISLTRILGENMVICNYQNQLSLFQRGNFQANTIPGLWEKINLGGLSFKQCLADIANCSFYQDLQNN